MAQSLSGLESFDPSGSTPQPAPLSGLALPSLFGGMGGEQGMAGVGGGAPGGQQGGPGLDFFQLLGSMQGSGDSGISAAPPNLSSLFGQIGQGGLGAGNLGQMDGNGAFGGFGQAGGMSQPTVPSGATGIAGSTGGQLDSIALIRQALGLGQGVAKGLNTGVAGSSGAGGGTGGLDLGDFEGTSLSNAEGVGVASPFQQGDLISPFLNDPMIGRLMTSGVLTGSQMPSELWDSFKSDPQFLEALRSGNALGDSNLLADYPLGGTGGLQMPNLSGDSPGSSQTGEPGISSGLGGLNSIMGLVQNIQAGGGNPMSLLQNLYGAYQSANNLAGLGGPTIQSALGALGAGGLGGLGVGVLGALPGIIGSDKPGDAAALAAGGLISGSMGATMAGIAAIPSLWELINDTDLFGLIPHDRMQETRGIKKDFDTAWGPYQDTPNTLNSISQSNDPAELQRLLSIANYQLAQAPAVSRYITTHGGYKPGIAPAQDLSAISPYSQGYSMDAVLGNTLALDKLANLGASPDMGPQGLNISDIWGGGNAQSVNALMGGLWNSANPQVSWTAGGQPQDVYNDFTQMYEKKAMPWTVTPEQAASFAQPGHRLQGIQDLFSGLNPQFANTPLGMTLAHLLGV